jgi:hypothetical protein
MEYGTGALCASLAGHDKGEVFVIIEEDGEYVCLVNGASRPFAKAEAIHNTGSICPFWPD